MHRSSRKLVTVEGQGDNGWEGSLNALGCLFLLAPLRSLNEWMLNLDVQLSDQFAAPIGSLAKAAKAG